MAVALLSASGFARGFHRSEFGLRLGHRAGRLRRLRSFCPRGRDLVCLRCWRGPRGDARGCFSRGSSCRLGQARSRFGLLDLTGSHGSPYLDRSEPECSYISNSRSGCSYLSDCFCKSRKSATDCRLGKRRRGQTPELRRSGSRLPPSSPISSIRIVLLVMVVFNFNGYSNNASPKNGCAVPTVPRWTTPPPLPARTLRDRGPDA